VACEHKGLLCLSSLAKMGPSDGAGRGRAGWLGWLFGRASERAAEPVILLFRQRADKPPSPLSPARRPPAAPLLPYPSTCSVGPRSSDARATRIASDPLFLGLQTTTIAQPKVPRLDPPRTRPQQGPPRGRARNPSSSFDPPDARRDLAALLARNRTAGSALFHLSVQACNLDDPRRCCRRRGRKGAVCPGSSDRAR
jgi:hypothetical protein